jgi:hypothetical protein
MNVVIRLLLTVMIAVPALEGSLAQVAGTTGGEIASDCADYPDSARPNTCVLYVASLVEIVRMDDKSGNPRGRLCIGEDVPIAEVIAVVNEWLAAHPEVHAMTAYDAAYGALAKKYQCK